jgi:hypothetical protein
MSQSVVDIVFGMRDQDCMVILRTSHTETTKPCPFCGQSTPHIPDFTLRDGCKDGEPDAWACAIRCRSCACQGPWSKGDDKPTALRRALKQWDTRV